MLVPSTIQATFAIQTSGIILPFQNAPNYIGKLWKNIYFWLKWILLLEKLQISPPLLSEECLISVYSCFDLAWNDIIQLKNLLKARSKTIKPPLSPYIYPTLTWDSGVFISLIQTKISQKSDIHFNLPFGIYCESDTNKYASLMNRDILFSSVSKKLNWKTRQSF